MTNPILEKARVSIDNGDLAEAQALLAEALIEDSNDLDAWMMLADILPADQAQECLERVIQIDPAHAPARARLGLPALVEAPLEAHEAFETLGETLPAETATADEVIVEEIAVETEAEAAVEEKEEEAEEAEALFPEGEPAAAAVAANLAEEIPTEVLPGSESLTFEERIEETAEEAGLTPAAADETLAFENLFPAEAGVDEESSAETGMDVAAPEGDFSSLFMPEEEKPQDFSFEALIESAEQSAAEEESGAAHEISEDEFAALLAQMEAESPSGAESESAAAPGGDEEVDFETLLAGLNTDEEREREEAAAAGEYVEEEVEENASETFFRDLFSPENTAESGEEARPAEAIESQEEEQTAVFAIPEADDVSFAAEEVEGQDNEEPTLSFETPSEEDDVGEGVPPTERQATPDGLPAQEGARPEKRKRRSRRRSLRGLWISLGVIAAIIAALFGGFVWYYFYGPCGVQRVIDSDAALGELTARWDESMIIATRSSRLVLAEPLRRMFDIRREVDKTDVPECLLPAKSSLQKSMYYTLDAYDKLFKYESDLEITKRFILASQQRKLYETQIDAVRYCAPLSCP